MRTAFSRSHPASPSVLGNLISIRHPLHRHNSTTPSTPHRRLSPTDSPNVEMFVWALRCAVAILGTFCQRFLNGHNPKTSKPLSPRVLLAHHADHLRRVFLATSSFPWLTRGGSPRTSELAWHQNLVISVARPCTTTYISTYRQHPTSKLLHK